LHTPEVLLLFSPFLLRAFLFLPSVALALHTGCYNLNTEMFINQGFGAL